MLRGFGPSESALAREGLLSGIATPEVGGPLNEGEDPKVINKDPKAGGNY